VVIALFLSAALALAGGPAHAAAGPGATPQVLAQLANRAQTTANDGQLAALADQARVLEAQAVAAVAADSARLEAVDRELAPPRGRHRRPTPAVLAPLVAQRAAVSARLVRERALAAQATATVDQIAERRREGFTARVMQRSDSPLSPGFWAALAGAVDADMGRLASVAGEGADHARLASEPQGLGGLAAGVLAGLVIAFPIRRRLEQLGRREAAAGGPPGFAGIASAVWMALVRVALPTLAAKTAQLGAAWGGLLSPRVDTLADSAVAAVAWAAAIVALGRALATAAHPGRRLLPVTDADAARLRFPIALAALVTACGFLLTRLVFVAGASLAATVAVNCVLSLAYAAVAAVMLVSFNAARDREADAGAPAWTLVSLLLSLTILATVVAVLAGYTNLAATISGQVFWFAIVAGVAWLLLRLVDQGCLALFAENGWAERTLFGLFNLRRSTIGQAGVLISAGLQLVILVAAARLALTPFGQSGNLLIGDLTRVGGSLRIGSVTISPTAVAMGLAALMVGVGLAHMVQGWFVRRYLPVTDWDAGVRNSAATGVGYLGVFLALAAALAAMGLDLRQMALIASALSVGIGFGLQQVVQNFVSGVILLVERPVKVGDRISVDGVEGDIRRIRVRATEIQVSDRSTVIVPNSDLITKQVQNRTLGDARSRVELRLAVADPAHAITVRELVLEAAAAKPEVLTDPPPQVFLDALASGEVKFTCYVFIRNPRDAQRIRSEIYYDLLQAFADHKVEFAAPPK
jgi:small-conductance mechanosensitive channel